MAFSQFTLAQLQTQARTLADMANSQFVSDDELTGFINRGWSKVYDKMIQSYGENYWGITTPVVVTMVTDQAFYPVPDGVLYAGAPVFYKLLGVDFNLNGNTSDPSNWYTIWPFNFGERNRGNVVPRLNNVSRPVDFRYKLQGQSVWFSPVPSSGMFARLWYSPQCIPLVAPGDTVSNLMPGWEELVVVYAAAQMLVKAKEDTTDLKMQYAEALKDLMDAAINRDVGAPSTIVDVYNNGSAFGGDYGDDGGFMGGYI